jgi:pentatricopeptide repeat protein
MNTILYNAIINLYSKCQQADKALQFIAQMKQNGVAPSLITYTSICSSITNMQQARQLHNELLNSGISLTTQARNILLNMYAKCGDLETMLNLFNMMRKHSWTDIISWNTVLKSILQHNAKEALNLYKELLQTNIVPDNITFVEALTCCAKEGDLATGKQIHQLILTRKIPILGVLQTALINMYLKCQDQASAKLLLVNLPKIELKSWTAFIAAQSSATLAMDIFEKMINDGVFPDVIAFAALLNCCLNAKDLTVTKRAHEKFLSSLLQPTLSLANALVGAYGACGDIDTARSLFDIYKHLSQKSPTLWTTMMSMYPTSMLQNFC